ncbi:ESCO1/2 acetyl-transferase-domain-containing protein [Lobosporangium transversale]|uniref:ESCO1/2 acetyl-transferase-domain-containing protein n=1 Tax=Lobosporangium transversale TaxID=64571 RepID=A0A1Y2H1N7_9FUNG|nr:ESCO1/2 acetyl-transferase-domain-containing protein [Lobosporangium transversale]ORZ28468.1 ESCO1/2 acetyl-transferase-domain-containing protein [Lobosporangium transversale]|eukprot:XP_021886153.1 ESCO1/2 acetyl-transferase-domain-containing protein [Lobosporangium transversale]
MTYAGKGTGILKNKSSTGIQSTDSSHNSNNRTGSSNSNGSNLDVTSDGSDMKTEALTCGNSHATKTATVTKEVESSKKLEQLFLSFPKDRSKPPIMPPTSSSSSSPLPSPSKNPAATAKMTLKKPTTKLKREDDQLKQHYQCPKCGMPYVRGQPEDERTHDSYHRAALGGVDYPGYKNEVVVAQFNDIGTTSANDQNKNRRVSVGTSSSSAMDSNLSNSRIVMISMSDAGKPASPVEKRKVREVLEVVNKELGSVDFDPEQLESCKIFLYISNKKKVIGCVVAERIKQGFEILSADSSPEALPTSSSPSSSASSSLISSSTATLSLPSSGSNSSCSSMETKMMDSDNPPATNISGINEISISTSLSASSIPSTSSSSSSSSMTTSDHSGSAIFCSIVPQSAICGINRIWVSAHCRRQGIASRLLDAVRDRFIYACKLERKDLAFSQPTGDGKALARHYLETNKFLVYVE